MIESHPAPQKPRMRRRTGMLRTVPALLLREMSTTYGRSALGYFWAILEPVAAIALMSLVFSYAFNSPALGTNFPLFFATGMLPFVTYTDTAQKIAQSLRFSRTLLFYPGVTFIDALIARFLMSFMTNIMIVAIVFTGIIVIFDLRLIIDLPAIAMGLAMAFAFGAGIGTLNCYLLTAFPIWERVWAVLNRPLFLVSCIFFLYDTVPIPYKDWLWWNPIIHIVGGVRRGVYSTYDASYVSPLYVFSVSLVCMAVGLLLLRRHHKDLLNI